MLHIGSRHRAGKVGESNFIWQDVLHPEKVIDQPAPQPTVPHAVAARDTAIVVDIQHLPIRPTPIPRQEAPEAFGVPGAGMAV